MSPGDTVMVDGLLDAAKHPDLIYDVGMHKGEDTDFYLKKGFRVVGIEANPVLAQHCRERFRSSIQSGRLTVIEGAIVRFDAVPPPPGKVPFYSNEQRSVWGTADPAWAERNARMGAASHATEVVALDFREIIRQHGVPHFLKIDIEGLDQACVAALGCFRERPDYLSFESDKTSFAAITREVDTLVKLGYDAFQAVEQSGICRNQVPPNSAREGRYATHAFGYGCSGLFGAELDGTWKSRRGLLRQYRAIRAGYWLLGDDGVLNKLPLLGTPRLRHTLKWAMLRATKVLADGWYDTHARHASASCHLQGAREVTAGGSFAGGKYEAPTDPRASMTTPHTTDVKKTA